MERRANRTDRRVRTLWLTAAAQPVLERILEGEDVGTLFLAHGTAIPSRKRWIGYSTRPKGRFTLDDGARTAMEQRGKSLLAIGVISVEGEFAKGEVVSLADKSGHEFARGLTNFSAADVRLIAGKRTEEIRRLLDGLPYGEVIHCDNLVVTR